jgi:hypothetical protein
VAEEAFDATQENGRSKKVHELYRYWRYCFDEGMRERIFRCGEKHWSIGKKYWRRLKDILHPFIPKMPQPSNHTMTYLQDRCDVIKQGCSRWSVCLEQLRNAPPSGCTIYDYVSFKKLWYYSRFVLFLLVELFSFLSFILCEYRTT